ncbi:hypothetical protein DRE_03509 [Drechslerella stenobrocha 248]|uniref:F-box domain-containing protein n=1 Tax=Drechslerella stenobrocha 248 TaxID=1043628 RepID=W7IDS9_9PEZI|nr:hypothetical protein DRE_03509 [Drechslerella stenobrocha 248]
MEMEMEMEVEMGMEIATNADVEMASSSTSAASSPPASVVSTPSSDATCLTTLSSHSLDTALLSHLPPEIILEILSLCAWEDQDNFCNVSPLWHSYITKALRRTRFVYPPSLHPGISQRYTCGTHKLLRALTLSYLWTRPTAEMRLDKRSDGRWWPEGSVTEEWLGETFFWTESCTDPPVKGVKIRLKGCYWNNQEGDLVLQMTCFAGNEAGVSVADVCSRIKRLFTASPYRNVLVYDLELKPEEDGSNAYYLAGKAVLTKKA